MAVVDLSGLANYKPKSQPAAPAAAVPAPPAQGASPLAGRTIGQPSLPSFMGGSSGVSSPAIRGVGGVSGAPGMTRPSAGVPQVPGVKGPTATQGYFNRNFGDTNKYIAGQVSRYNTAAAANDTGLMGRLQADSKRVGYSLPNWNSTPSNTGVTGTGETVGTAGAETTAGTQNAEPGFTVDEFGNTTWHNPEAYQDPAQQIAATREATEKQKAYALLLMNQQMGFNQEDFNRAMGNLESQQAVDSNRALAFQNRFGGIYDGGHVTMQQGINTDYTNQRGQLEQDLAQRNATLHAQYGDQLRGFAEKLANTNLSVIQMRVDQAKQAKEDARLAKQDAREDAKVTGYYVDPDARPLYTELMSLKRQAEASTITASQRAELSARANQLRGQLMDMGYDVSNLGANSNHQTSANSPFGIVTEDRRQFDSTFNWGKEVDTTNMTGIMPNGMPTMAYTEMMASLTGYLPNGQKTTAEQQRELGNLWMVAQNTGTIPSALATLYDLPKGTKTMDALAMVFDQNYKTETLNLDKEANTRANNAQKLDEKKFNYDSQNKEEKPVKFNNQEYNRAVNTLRESYGKAGKDTKDQTYYYLPDKESRYNAFAEIASYGLDPIQESQLMRSVGISKEQESEFREKSGYSSGK